MHHVVEIVSHLNGSIAIKITVSLCLGYGIVFGKSSNGAKNNYYRWGNSCSEGIVREYCVKSDGFGGGMQIVSDKIRNFAVGSVPGGVGL